MKSWICRTQCAVCRVDRNWQCFKYLATALQGDYFVYANNKDEIISYFRTQEYCLDTHLSWLLLSAGSVLRSCSWRCSCTRRSRLGRSSWWRGWTRPGRRPSWSGPGSRAWSFIIMKKLPYYRASWMRLLLLLFSRHYSNQAARPLWPLHWHSNITYRLKSCLA